MGHEKVDAGIFDLYNDVPTADAVTNAHERDVIGNKTDTVGGTSLVSLVKVVDAVVDAIAVTTVSGDASGSTNYTDAGGEQTIYELVNTKRKVLHGVWLDLTTMTQNGTIKIYYKIDATNYREVESYAFTVATDSDGIYIDLNMGITNDFKVTYTEGADEAAIRAVPYSIIYEVKE